MEKKTIDRVYTLSFVDTEGTQYTIPVAGYSSEDCVERVVDYFKKEDIEVKLKEVWNFENIVVWLMNRKHKPNDLFNAEEVIEYYKKMDE